MITRSTTIRTLMGSMLVAGALLSASVAPLSAHGGGVLRLASPTVPVGGELVLTGAKFDTSASYRLELRGILDNYPVGQIVADAAGKFQTRIVLPPHVPAGVYTLVAIAADGDAAARTTVTVGGNAGPAGSGANGAMPGMAEHGTQQMSAMHGSAEMMVLERSSTPGEWAVIVAFTVLSLGGGLLLLRRGTVVRRA